ncbi:hypothetical protein LX32DRAFT_636112 [Colletotrichum zoysiae]|uniref:Uncharacterized protein n=1 Tax=Colletotrichum zoysiae TaxID=1216348 RepID=A0AAD9HNT8_9PEZI|nr:hypothetical protein LX32DRAFT_636112 [Colletotrichum zoysiae]
MQVIRPSSRQPRNLCIIFLQFPCSAFLHFANNPHPRITHTVCAVFHQVAGRRLTLLLATLPSVWLNPQDVFLQLWLGVPCRPPISVQTSWGHLKQKTITCGTTGWKPKCR